MTFCDFVMLEFAKCPDGAKFASQFVSNDEKAVRFQERRSPWTLTRASAARLSDSVIGSNFMLILYGPKFWTLAMPVAYVHNLLCRMVGRFDILPLWCYIGRSTTCICVIYFVLIITLFILLCRMCPWRHKIFPAGTKNSSIKDSCTERGGRWESNEKKTGQGVGKVWLYADVRFRSRASNFWFC